MRHAISRNRSPGRAGRVPNHSSPCPRYRPDRGPSNPAPLAARRMVAEIGRVRGCTTISRRPPTTFCDRCNPNGNDVPSLAPASTNRPRSSGRRCKSPWTVSPGATCRIHAARSTSMAGPSNCSSMPTENAGIQCRCVRPTLYRIRIDSPTRPFLGNNRRTDTPRNANRGMISPTTAAAITSTINRMSRLLPRSIAGGATSTNASRKARTGRTAGTRCASMCRGYDAPARSGGFSVHRSGVGAIVGHVSQFGIGVDHHALCGVNRCIGDRLRRGVIRGDLA